MAPVLVPFPPEVLGNNMSAERKLGRCHVVNELEDVFVTPLFFLPKPNKNFVRTHRARFLCIKICFVMLKEMAKISDFHQPATVTIQSLETGGAGISSSFGPANVLRLRSEAQMWSKSGGQVSLKSLGADTLLLARELRVVCPIEIRFMSDNGHSIYAVNVYSGEQGSSAGTSADGSNDDFKSLFKTAANRVKEFNSVSMRPFGWLRSIQN